MTNIRDHGGGLDAATACFGGRRENWLDLSTGINPTPYPVKDIGFDAWTALPDSAAVTRLEKAARRFWNVPNDAEIVIAPGASALIARMPQVFSGATQVYIPGPTYNEHRAAFEFAGCQVTESPEQSTSLQVLVHPNNPTGQLWTRDDLRLNEANIVDESFCDVTPSASLVAHAIQDNVIVLKSFGKFWGLAGMRLGFAICSQDVGVRLRGLLGPWPVSGPALEIGAMALEDLAWANATRERLASDASILDDLVLNAGGALKGGTSLFRLYEVDDAASWQDRLAKSHVWSRVFPYSKTWLRLGLPPQDRWAQLEAAL